MAKKKDDFTDEDKKILKYISTELGEISSGLKDIHAYTDPSNPEGMGKMNTLLNKSMDKTFKVLMVCTITVVASAILALTLL